MNLNAIIPIQLDGSEEIISPDSKKNITDFWKWAYSDLIGNTERGIFAEYLVALACKIDNKPRISWGTYDLEIEESTKLEVKTSGYLQSWKQNNFSKTIFGIPKTLAWNSIENTFEKDRMRHADIYVFALHNHKDKFSINPLNTNQWTFYLLDTETIDLYLGDSKSISIKKIIDLGAIESDFENLQLNIKNLNYKCPICKIKLKFNARYPKYVCNKCFDKTVDSKNRKLSFCNVGLSGGYIATFADSNEEYKSHECYINGVKCYADEAKFGGIVIETL